MRQDNHSLTYLSANPCPLPSSFLHLADLQSPSTFPSLLISKEPSWHRQPRPSSSLSVSATSSPPDSPSARSFSSSSSDSSSPMTPLPHHSFSVAISCSSPEPPPLLHCPSAPSSTYSQTDTASSVDGISCMLSDPVHCYIWGGMSGTSPSPSCTEHMDLGSQMSCTPSEMSLPV
jgi:hypothetical protein